MLWTTVDCGMRFDFQTIISPFFVLIIEGNSWSRQRLFSLSRENASYERKRSTELLTIARFRPLQKTQPTVVPS